MSCMSSNAKKQSRIGEGCPSGDDVQAPRRGRRAFWVIRTPLTQPGYIAWSRPDAFRDFHFFPGSVTTAAWR